MNALASLDSLRWFRRLALLGAVLAATVVVLGAWVRLTDAGLGCPDWPGCYGHLYPQAAPQAARAWHEMVHRYFAGTLVATIAALAIWAWLARRRAGQPLGAVVALFLVVCAQAVLGALTVTQRLNPLVVTAHLFGGLTTLSLLWWLALPPPQGPLSARERALRPWAILALGVLIAQIGLGGWTSSNYAALACPDFPTCQHAWWPDADFRAAFSFSQRGIDYEGGVLASPARTAIHLSHRLGALVTGLLLLGLGASVMARARRRRRVLAGALVVLAVVLQISVGISVVRFGVPLPLATLHNAGAALLVVSLVTLLRSLWPGRAEEGAPAYGPVGPRMVPLSRVDAPR
ncbi:MAG TPA: COX15/CtaA family protein [Steroidobacteraceae bacterium]|nr:COX15/CtaA family protein [Steroidobacteraceae bacterium]